MRKVRRIFDTPQEIYFQTPQKDFNAYWHSFLESELGQIYQSIPWQELVKSFKIKENSKGPTRLFPSQGMLALMFLKSYIGCSDQKLILHLNGNIDFQMFCGIFLGSRRISNFKIVSEIRCVLSKNLDIKSAQKILADYWKPKLECTNIMLEDATCYETAIRYPTNVKLLFESVEWTYGQLKVICKFLKIRMPRNKYSEQYDKYYQYSRKRKKTHGETNKRIKSLLYLLEKLLGEIKAIEEDYHQELDLPKKYYQRIKLVKTVLKQQKQMFETGESVSERIVSLSKSYIRPIVRGKETKAVEFGAKVNMIQIDGINFIEHLSFDAFNEGIRLKKSVGYGRELFGRITHLAADSIYANNANRKYCTRWGIVNNFKRKGRAGRHEEHRKIISGELNKERATRMEGSFGTEKEYYGLQKIKARTKQTEIFWIFIGVHTANVVRVAKRYEIIKKSKIAA